MTNPEVLSAGEVQQNTPQALNDIKEEVSQQQKENIQQEAYEDFLNTVTDLNFEKFGSILMMSVAEILSLFINPESKESVYLAGNETDPERKEVKRYDIAQLFLIKNGKKCSNENLEVGDVLTVNFGEHKEVEKKMGAGDLLKPEVTKVKIDGEECIRKEEPRPGYYRISNGTYAEIWDGDKIEILVIGELTEEEKKIAEEKRVDRFNQVRTGEFMDYLYEKRSEKEIAIPEIGGDYSEIFVESLQKIFSDSNNIYFDKKREVFGVHEGTIGKEIDIINEYNGESYRHLPYIRHINELSQKYPRVTSACMIKLGYKENDTWDPMRANGRSSAVGINQMIDGTWATYGKGLDRFDPLDQLESMARYLTAIRDNKDCSIEEALAYYNTGEGVGNISNEQARKYAMINESIANNIPGVYVRNGRILKGADLITAQTYFEGAVKYYNT